LLAFCAGDIILDYKHFMHSALPLKLQKYYRFMNPHDDSWQLNVPHLNKLRYAIRKAIFFYIVATCIAFVQVRPGSLKTLIPVKCAFYAENKCITLVFQNSV
jgi:hypothetical protein